MKRLFAVLAAFSAALLTGCSRDVRESVGGGNSGDTETVFDYFYSEDMPWDEIREFELPEFPYVKFAWDHLNIVSEKDGEKTELFWGMPIWSVYLADLNGDGKREICSTVSIGSGIVDERIIVYDYANGECYELQDRFFHRYELELKNGELFYVETPERADGEQRSEPLTLDIMTKLGK